MRYEIENISGEALAKRMLFLAWKASKCVGMGFLQDKGSDRSENDLWEQAGKGNRVNADYVDGRMMKLYFKFDEKGVIFPSPQERANWRPDYQSFTFWYPNFETLCEAAKVSLEEDQK